MSRARIVVLCLIAVGCSSERSAPRQAVEADPPPAPATPPTAPVVSPPPAAPPRPAADVPSTPEALDAALSAAMVAGRDLDVIRYCEQAKIVAGEGNPQTQLGCTLAACRAAEADKARAWSAKLPRPLRKQAIQICLANQVTL